MNYLQGILPEQLNSVWEQVRPLIAEACVYNNCRYLAMDYYEDIITSKKQLWLVKSDKTLRAIVITEIGIFPRKKCCAIDMCTGEGLEEWVELLPIIEQWGRDQGCSQMFFNSRIGFERKLKQHGYVKTHSLLEKELY